MAYIKCAGCEFVLEAGSFESPEPKHWDSCPDCGESDFRFLESGDPPKQQ